MLSKKINEYLFKDHLGKMKKVAATLKAIHAQEGIIEAGEKAVTIAEKLDKIKLYKAAKKVRDSIDKTMSYYNFPAEHRRHIWTNIRLNESCVRSVEGIVLS